MKPLERPRDNFQSCCAVSLLTVMQCFKEAFWLYKGNRTRTHHDQQTSVQRLWRCLKDVQWSRGGTFEWHPYRFNMNMTCFYNGQIWLHTAETTDRIQTLNLNQSSLPELCTLPGELLINWMTVGWSQHGVALLVKSTPHSAAIKTFILNHETFFRHCDWN